MHSASELETYLAELKSRKWQRCWLIGIPVQLMLHIINNTFPLLQLTGLSWYSKKKKEFNTTLSCNTNPNKMLSISSVPLVSSVIEKYCKNIMARNKAILDLCNILDPWKFGPSFFGQGFIMEKRFHLLLVQQLFDKLILITFWEDC